jgi:hypothetical protein
VCLEEQNFEKKRIREARNEKKKRKEKKSISDNNRELILCG